MRGAQLENKRNWENQSPHLGRRETKRKSFPQSVYHCNDIDRLPNYHQCLFALFDREKLTEQQWCRKFHLVPHFDECSPVNCGLIFGELDGTFPYFNSCLGLFIWSHILWRMFTRCDYEPWVHFFGKLQGTFPIWTIAGLKFELAITGIIRQAACLSCMS